MKTLVLLLFLINSVLVIAQEKFDIISYTAPKGWAVDKKTETVTFTKDGGTDGFCIITLYKNIDTGNDSKQNFDISWESLVQNQLGIGAAEMQPPSTDDGWEIQVGSSQFDKEGIQGAAILLTSTRNNKMVNILIMTNTDRYQDEMEKFLESVTLTKVPNTNSENSSNSSVKSTNSSKDKPELWANWRANPYSEFSQKDLSVINDFYLIYPNGDYFPNVPYEGLAKVDRSFQPESWGKFTLKGNKGRFKNNYDEITVIRKSDTHMEKEGYSYGYYKCLSVDGARIEGYYTHVSPNWGKDPQLDYLDDAGCQFTLQFKKDGTFIDNGIFSSSPYNCVAGKGTYSIENYTITFQYDDGKVVQRLFSAPPTRNIKNYSETIFMGTTPYYKKDIF